MTIADFVQDLQTLAHRGIHKSIDNIRTVLQKRGHPERSYPIVHVAGTNGKGSSCTFLASLMAQNGYRVGLALSPHVETFAERLQLHTPERSGHDALIRDDELLRLHAELKKQNSSFFGLTYFEYGLLLALEWFREEKVDLVVLETGLGGRWDATNACPSVVSGIVSVGLDHMNDLGDTLEKILLEKIEIAKPNTDFVFAPSDSGLVTIAKEFCKTREVCFFSVSPQTEFLKKQNLQRMPEIFQKNLQFAATLAERLHSKGFRFDSNKTYQLHLPVARLETLQTAPDFLLDGAHNEPALIALKTHLQKHYGENYDLVFGCLKDRDALHLAKFILPAQGEKYWVTFPAEGREMAVATQKALQQNYGGHCHDLSDAFVQLCLERKRTKPLVVCGSFYLCGAFRKLYLEMTRC